MSTLTVYDMKGASTGTFEIPEQWLVRGKGEQAVHDVVVAYLAGRRAGTASTLTKGEVSGSGKKPWRQKGTGRARAGYRQSPVWRGGAVVFGPRPRSYAKKVNRKVAQLAFRRAFTDRVDAGSVRMVEELDFPEVKSRLLTGFLKALGIGGGVLLVVDRVKEDLARTARNVVGVEVVAAETVHTYQMLRYRDVVISRAGVEAIGRRLMPEGGSGK